MSDDNEVNASRMTVAAIYSHGQSKMRNQAPDVRIGITMSVARNHYVSGRNTGGSRIAFPRGAVKLVTKAGVQESPPVWGCLGKLAFLN